MLAYTYKSKGKCELIEKPQPAKSAFRKQHQAENARSQPQPVTLKLIYNERKCTAAAVHLLVPKLNSISINYDKYSKPSPKSLANISPIVHNKIPSYEDYN